jgi:hypothetical protein
MARVDELADRFHRHVSAPWQKNLTGAERTVFLVYPRADERKLLARLPLYEEKTRQAGHGWRVFSFHSLFTEWFATLDSDHQQVLLEEPESFHLEMDLDGHHDSPFTRYVATKLLDLLSEDASDADAVIALIGAGSLYGFTRLSAVLDRVRHALRGQLLVFFPGSFDGNQYRLLDARDGASYLAVPITPFNGAFES